MTTSATDTNESSVGAKSSLEQSIHQRVIRFADQASDRSEFLKLLATELSESFAVELVAVASHEWTAPMMLVSDPAVAQRINQNAIGGLLRSATQLPIACDVPCRNGDNHARGLRVEITGTPEQSALLLLYDAEERPTATRQVQDLKRLSEYANSSRDVLADLPAGRSATTAASKSQAPNDNAATSLGHRHSLQWFHRDLDLNATAYRIANETRRLIGCDRVSVLFRTGRRYRVRAVSGVSVVDRRSNSVTALESLAVRSAVMERPLIMPGVDPLPPQIQQPLDEYLDETGVLSTIMLPLHRPSDANDTDSPDSAGEDFGHHDQEILALVFLEYFSGEAPTAITPAMRTINREATFAIRNSMEHHKVFGLRLWKLLGTLLAGKRMAFAVLASLLLMTALIASLVIQIEHEVIASGTLVPASQRQVFAQVDGIVKEIFVADGDVVSVGDRLFRLENADLETRAENLAGEIQTATRRLASVQSLRLSMAADPNQSNRLAIEERQLASELSNLNAQQELVRQQQEQLIVRSPIDGTIAGWQLERQLSDRPVSRGNLLVSVVDHNGPWSLRLKVPDQDAGPVLESFRESASLNVRFAVATQPDSTYAARLETISTAARMADDGENVVDATAAVIETDDESIDYAQASFSADGARVGADVTAKIACGKRTVLRSWFGDVFDFVNRNVLFYFR
ncbi:efflux RND transporter periplasmic adaptor subunit [Stieleria varia]|uniref:HlyD family secretion protein n=1 Tax=Stieleria varia TaxID=2528005 RepID=A0A5C6B1F1_9BACT|nr:HlyD family efflux transporter periplasmic adaptor subunit [Stieleria varia]TWU05708.1 HlyD family secretion protein [Stieleria varia]